VVDASGLTAHWDTAHGRGASVSWHQDQPAVSLQLIDALAIPPTASVVDVGGGSSPFAARLLGRSFGDVTVLDLSSVGLATARMQLGERASDIAWVQADVLTWQPDRRYDVWHDRAVFHFLTNENDRAAYRQTLEEATTSDAVLLMATFARGGPDHCSGLPVNRYDAPDLAQQFGPSWRLVHHETEKHVTPSGGIQPFTWAAFRRTGH
jgi:hypothetical protein